jgi:hypothetical protein
MRDSADEAKPIAFSTKLNHRKNKWALPPYVTKALAVSSRTWTTLILSL